MVWLQKRLTQDTNPSLWRESPVFGPSNHPTSSICRLCRTLNSRQTTKNVVQTRNIFPITLKVVLDFTKSTDNSCLCTRIYRLHFITISRNAVRLGWTCSMNDMPYNEHEYCNVFWVDPSYAVLLLEKLPNTPDLWLKTDPNKCTIYSYNLLKTVPSVFRNL